MTLEGRLKRIEQTEARSGPQAERRVIRITAGENDTEAAYALARAAAAHRNANQAQIKQRRADP